MIFPYILDKVSLCSTSLVKAKQLLLILSSFCFNDTYTYKYDRAEAAVSVYSLDGTCLKKVRPDKKCLPDAYLGVGLLCTNEAVVVLGHSNEYSINRFVFVQFYTPDLSKCTYQFLAKDEALVQVQLVSNTLFLLFSDLKLHSSNYFRIFNLLSNQEFTKELDGDMVSMSGNDTHLAIVAQKDADQRHSTIMIYSLQDDRFVYEQKKVDAQDVHLSKSRLFLHRYHPTKYAVLDLYKNFQPISYDTDWETDTLGDVHDFGVIPGSNSCFIVDRHGSAHVIDEHGKMHFLLNLSAYQKDQNYRWVGPYLVLGKRTPTYPTSDLCILHIENLAKMPCSAREFTFDLKGTKLELSDLILGPYFIQFPVPENILFPLPDCSAAQVLRAKNAGYLTIYFNKYQRGAPYRSFAGGEEDVDEAVLVASLYSDDIARAAWQVVASHLATTANLDKYTFVKAWKTLVDIGDPHALAIMYLSYIEGIWGAKEDMQRALPYHQPADRKTIFIFYKHLDKFIKQNQG